MVTKNKIFYSIAMVSFASIILTSNGCGSDTNDSRLVLGTGDKLLEPNILQYQLPYVVQVTDVDGNPSPSVQVSFTLRPTQYFKGQYVATDISIPADGLPDIWVATVSATCATEDIDGNGQLDVGEDVNGNTILDPANGATITAHPTELPTITSGNSLITDSNGFGFFVVTYPKSEGSWLSMQLTATAADGLPGNTEIDIVNLPVTVQDVSDTTVSPPGGVSSAYGTAAICSDAS